MRLVYVIAWVAVVFGINSTSNAEVITWGEAKYNVLYYKCYAQVALLASLTSATAGVASLASHCRGCELAWWEIFHED